MALWNPTTLTEKEFNPHTEANHIIELDGFEVYRLEKRLQTIHVLAGCAWITVAGRDVFVPRGETIRLYPEREYSIISSPNFRQLVFEIHYQ